MSFRCLGRGGLSRWFLACLLAGVAAAPLPADAARLVFQPGFIPLGSRAVFQAVHPTAGPALWITDGTSGGTRVLAGGFGDLVTPFAEHEGRLYLLLNPNVRQHPEEVTTLWVTDGTPAGTFELPVPFGSIDQFVALGGDPGGPLLFVAPADFVEQVELAVWGSDGTVSGTRARLRLGEGRVEAPARLGDRFVFAFHRIPPLPAVLWSLDADGGDATGVETAAEWLGGSAVFGGEILAMATAGGLELWGLAADGSAPRPVARLGDLDVVGPGVGVFALDGGAFLSARELGRAFDHVWISDGTATGTAPLDFSLAWIDDERLDVFAGRLWLTGATLDGRPEIWVSDGTRAGTKRLVEVSPLADPRRITFQELEGGVVFLAPIGSSVVPWFSDGTAQGTAPLGEVCAQPCYAGARSFVVWNGAVYATFDDGAGTALWRFDRDLPPLRLTDLAVDPRPDVGVAGDRLVFLSEDGVLWSSDGRPAGTAPSVDLARVAPDLAPCVLGSHTLCLGDGRFSVTAALVSGFETLRARARRLEGSERSGWFWGFAADNPEIVIKILDGTPVNGRWWVFVGPLTGLSSEVRVLDSVTGVTRIYRKAEGATDGVIDLDAFAADYEAKRF